MGQLTLLSDNLLLVAELGPPVWHRLEAAGADEVAALRGAAVLLRCCAAEARRGVSDVLQAGLYSELQA